MSIFSKIAKIISNIDEFITGGMLTREVINRYIKGYGEMLKLEVNTKEKTILASLLLNGENTPIEVKIDKYELINGNSQINIKSMSSDRAWIDALLKNFFIDKTFKIPKKSIDFIDDFLSS